MKLHMLAPLLPLVTHRNAARSAPWMLLDAPQLLLVVVQTTLFVLCRQRSRGHSGVATIPVMIPNSAVQCDSTCSGEFATISRGSCVQRQACFWKCASARQS
mgnify:CR=1 FL=1